MHNEYRIFLTNFGYRLLDVFLELEEAMFRCEKIGFECAIFIMKDFNEYIVKSWSPIGGFKTLD